MTKWCPRCSSTKSVSDFYNNRARYDGLYSYCKPCQGSYSRGRQTTKRNRKRRAAARMVQAAVDGGYLTREPCERCGESENVQGHHDDYERPLEVMWLCSRHHGERHSELNAIERGRVAQKA